MWQWELFKIPWTFCKVLAVAALHFSIHTINSVIETSNCEEKIDNQLQWCLVFIHLPVT